MKIGIYPGSFDPMTNGHLDIIERGAKLVDQLIVAILINPDKPQGLLAINDRLEVIKEATAHLDNVRITYFSGLLADYAKEVGEAVIIRGIRSVKDLEMELAMAQVNKQLGSGLETIFLMTAPEYSCISSSTIREIFAFNGDYKGFVPEAVYNKLKTNKMRGNEGGKCKE